MLNVTPSITRTMPDNPPRAVPGPAIGREKGLTMIYTVFPKDPDRLPQDFPTYSQAKEYGDTAEMEAGYEIESTDGNCE